MRVYRRYEKKNRGHFPIHFDTFFTALSFSDQTLKTGHEMSLIQESFTVHRSCLLSSFGFRARFVWVQNMHTFWSYHSRPLISQAKCTYGACLFAWQQSSHGIKNEMSSLLTHLFLFYCVVQVFLSTNSREIFWQIYDEGQSFADFRQSKCNPRPCQANADSQRPKVTRCHPSCLHTLRRNTQGKSYSNGL